MKQMFVEPILYQVCVGVGETDLILVLEVLTVQGVSV